MRAKDRPPRPSPAHEWCGAHGGHWELREEFQKNSSREIGIQGYCRYHQNAVRYMSYWDKQKRQEEKLKLALTAIR